eukprot:734696_1
MGCCLSSAKPDEDLELDKDLMALEEANGGTGDPPENFVDNVKFGFANLMDDVRSGFSKVKNFDRIKSGADKFFDKDRTYNQRMPLVVALLLCIIVTLAVLYGSAYAVHGLSGSQSQQTNNVDYEAITETSTSYSNAPPTKKSSEATSVEINQSNGIRTEQTIAGLAFPYGGSKAATRKPHRERGVPQYFQLIDKQPGVESAYSNQSDERKQNDGSDTDPSFSASLHKGDKETKSNKHAAMEPKSDATPVNSNTHATDNTETQLASHSNDSPIVDHLNEEQNDNKPGEETKSNKKAAMESKSDATPVAKRQQTRRNSNAINTVITGPPLTSHFYDAPQVGHPDEEQKDNKHGAKLREEQESAKLREEPEAKRIQKEQAGGNSTNENEDAELTSRTTPNKTDKQTNADQLSGYGVTFPTFTDTSELQIESGVSSNFPPTYTPSGDELADINHPENIRTAPINKKDPPEQHVAAGTNDQNDGFKYNSGSGNQAPSKYNNYNGSNTYSQDISSGQQLHKKEPQNQSQNNSNNNNNNNSSNSPQSKSEEELLEDSHNALFAQEINKQNDVGGDKGGLRDQEASGFTKIKLDAKADHENDDKETQVYVDITSLDKALQLVNDLPKPNEQEDSEINREELKEEFDDVTVTNSRTHEETQDNGEDDRKESVNRKNDDQMDSNIFHPNSNDGIVDERQLVKYNPQIHSPESKERRIMLDRFHAYNQKTHYSNLDPRIMSFLNTSSKNIANQFQTVKYNSPIRRVSHTPESKERRIMLDRVQSYYQKTHFADDYHNDTSNTNDVVFPRFSILQDNSQEGMCFVILYPSASHDSVDNYQILSGVQDVVTESFDARSIQDTTIFPAKVISNTYPKSLILRATLKDGSCIDSGVPLPPPSVAFTLKMGTDNSDTVLDLRRAVGITDDEATEYQLSVGPDRDDMSGIIHQFTGKVAHEKNGMLKVDSTNLQGAKVGRIRAIKYIGGRNGNRVISDSFTEIKSDEVSTGHDDDDYEDDVDDDDDNKRSDHDDEHDKRDGEEDDEGGDDDEERVEADGNYDDNDDNNGGEASKDDNVPESHQDGGGGSGDGNEHGVSIND